jgi:hypothetical protein
MGFFSEVETTSSFTSGNTLIPEGETVLVSVVDVEDLPETKFTGECIKITFEISKGQYTGQLLTKKLMQNAVIDTKDYKNAFKILGVFKGLNAPAFAKHLEKLQDLSDLDAALLSRVIAGKQLFVTVGVMPQEYTNQRTGEEVKREINFIRSLFVEQQEAAVKAQVKEKEKAKAMQDDFDDDIPF